MGKKQVEFIMLHSAYTGLPLYIRKDLFNVAYMRVEHKTKRIKSFLGFQRTVKSDAHYTVISDLSGDETLVEETPEKLLELIKYG